VGNRLVYYDAAGSWVVEVNAGVPGTPKPVGATTHSFAWSPTGLLIRMSGSPSSLEYVDLGGAAPTFQLLGTASVPPTFSSDGSAMAFSGTGLTGQAGVFYSRLGAQPTPPELLSQPFDGGTFPCCPSWAFDSLWMTYRDVSSDFSAVDLSGTAPGPIVKVPTVQLGTRPTWIPRSTTLALLDSSYMRLQAFDVTKPLDPPKLLSEPNSPDTINDVQGSPAGGVVAYRTNTKVGLASVGGGLPTMINFSTPFGMLLAQVTWSPNGRFLAVTRASQSTTSRTYDAKVVRIDGVVSSAPFDLAGSSAYPTTVVWQP
jgi:hypothetical protein